MSHPSDPPEASIAAMLRDRIGLDHETLGGECLRRAYVRRMEVCGVDDGDDYAERLLRDESEFDELVEELLVPETWFFRDVEPFLWLRRFVKDRSRSDASGEPLRVLSVPCSTGEEPYSVAMTLLDLGLAPGQIQIDAVDLSQRALDKAAKGKYSKSSFRGEESRFSDLRDRFFRRRGSRYEVIDQVRAVVHFRRANLVALDFLAAEPVYHLILCRNVLIYLHAEAQQKALTRLHQLLAPDGFLYVGHVEARVTAEGPFRGLGGEFPFAFRPLASDFLDQTAVSADDAERPLHRGTVAEAARATRSDAKGVSPARSRVNRVSPVRGHTARGTRRVSEADLLATARDAADSGRLDQATAICETLLAERPASADVFCLLGLICQAGGRLEEAKTHFQKSLYLAPRHHEALVHMMLLAQQRGDE
ncbi:MAG: chemotaxis protein CheR, partial [Planctomycetes bacterium]|nr:chemotaxis protein CheR [Planctomycetota bacterium]